MIAINRLIDQACGIPPGWNPLYTIPMTCRRCNQSRMVKPDETDPPGTAAMRITCPDCDPDDTDKTPVEFFDNQTNPLPHP